MLTVSYQWKSYIVKGPVDELNRIQGKARKCVRTAPRQLILKDPPLGLHPAIDAAIGDRSNQTKRL